MNMRTRIMFIVRRRFPQHANIRLTERSIRTRRLGTHASRLSTQPPIIRIENGTFYKQHPSSGTNPPALFNNLDFTLPSFPTEPCHWAILGPSAATLLQILRGEHICIPPTARSYPYLNSQEIEDKDISLRLPSRAIRYVGFATDQGGLGGQGTSGAYLSARYESRREATDFSVLDYLRGNTELNALEDSRLDPGTLNRVIRDLRLEDLVNMPVSNLSNGQARRAKIARALLSKPEVLLLDEPFMGLDPPTLMTLSPLLHRLAVANEPRLILTLRPQDPIPDWTTHLLVLRANHTVALQGEKEHVLQALREYVWNVKNNQTGPDDGMHYYSSQGIGRQLTSRGVVETDNHDGSSLANMATRDPLLLSRDGYPLKDTQERKFGKPIIEMEGVRVTYGEKTVLGNWEEPENERAGLWWTIKEGERWGIFGPNGSGKTTMLSLICSDHPQTYSLPVKLFGRTRLPAPGEPGISIFDIQARIGHSSPEIHNHFPKKLTVRQTLENAWSETFMGLPTLDGDAKARVDSCLRWFEPELRSESNLNTRVDSAVEAESSTSWADDIYFRELPFSGQRVALFIRALIKNPDLVILDEAFSGMDETVRDKCMLFLAHGESKTYAVDFVSNNQSGNPRSAKGKVIDSEVHKTGKTKVWGLQDHQAMVCISHLPEEVPGSVREWICLEEANTRRRARIGKLEGPLEKDGYRMWNDIWGVGW